MSITGPRLKGNTLHMKALFSRVNGHSLVKVTHMLYEIGPSIINGEGQLGKAV